MLLAAICSFERQKTTTTLIKADYWVSTVSTGFQDVICAKLTVIDHAIKNLPKWDFKNEMRMKSKTKILATVSSSCPISNYQYHYFLLKKIIFAGYPKIRVKQEREDKDKNRFLSLTRVQFLAKQFRKTSIRKIWHPAKKRREKNRTRNRDQYY